MGPPRSYFYCLLYLMSVATLIYSQDNLCQLEGEIRLEGGSANYEGRVELCRGSEWGTICDNNWDANDAAVVCRQLGFQDTNAVARHDSEFQQGVGPIHELEYFCNGEESLLVQCESDNESCQHNDEAGVICTGAPCGNGDTRLVDDTSEHSGRVEVCLNQQWTGVCDDIWSSRDASVVCKQLGYTSLGAVPMTTTDFTLRPRRLQFLNCTGKESKLIDCPTIASQSLLPDCNPVGVTCSTITTATTTTTTTGSANIQATTISTLYINSSLTEAADVYTPKNIPVNDKIYPGIVAGVCAGVLLGVILLVHICLLAICCYRLRNYHCQQAMRQNDNIRMNHNECYACPPLPVGGVLEERENPYYEQPVPVCITEENPCYGYTNPYQISFTYESFYEVT